MLIAKIIEMKSKIAILYYFSRIIAIIDKAGRIISTPGKFHEKSSSRQHHSHLFPNITVQNIPRKEPSKQSSDEKADISELIIEISSQKLQSEQYSKLPKSLNAYFSSKNDKSPYLIIKFYYKSNLSAYLVPIDTLLFDHFDFLINNIGNDDCRRELVSANQNILQKKDVFIALISSISIFTNNPELYAFNEFKDSLNDIKESLAVERDAISKSKVSSIPEYHGLIGKQAIISNNISFLLSSINQKCELNAKFMLELVKEKHENLLNVIASPNEENENKRKNCLKKLLVLNLRTFQFIESIEDSWCICKTKGEKISKENENWIDSVSIIKNDSKAAKTKEDMHSGPHSLVDEITSTQLDLENTSSGKSCSQFDKNLNETFLPICNKSSAFAEETAPLIDKPVKKESTVVAMPDSDKLSRNDELSTSKIEGSDEILIVHEQAIQSLKRSHELSTNVPNDHPLDNFERNRPLSNLRNHRDCIQIILDFFCEYYQLFILISFIVFINVFCGFFI